MAENEKRALHPWEKDEKALSRYHLFSWTLSVHALQRITGVSRISLLFFQEIMLPGDLPIRQHKKPFSKRLLSLHASFLYSSRSKQVYLSAHYILYYVLYYSKSVFDSSIIFSKNTASYTKWAGTYWPSIHMMLVNALRRMHREETFQLLFPAAVGQANSACIRASDYPDYDFPRYQNYFLSDNLWCLAARNIDSVSLCASFGMDINKQVRAN